MRNIPPFKLVPIPLDDEARSLPEFQLTDHRIGKRHKLGGNPEFFRESEWPSCPNCGDRMNFYAQLDSINDEFCIADCGMIYVFLCFDCFETKSIILSN
jgi:hypothetical protein